MAPISEELEITFQDGMLCLHQFHPATGQDARTPDADSSPAERFLLEIMVRAGAHFVWLRSGDTYHRVRLDHMLDVVELEKQHGLYVCPCDHSKDSELGALLKPLTPAPVRPDLH